jgi:hypothetical protein
VVFAVLIQNILTITLKNYYLLKHRLFSRANSYFLSSEKGLRDAELSR